MSPRDQVLDILKNYQNEEVDKKWTWAELIESDGLTEDLMMLCIDYQRQCEALKIEKPWLAGTGPARPQERPSLSRPATFGEGVLPIQPPPEPFDPSAF